MGKYVKYKALSFFILIFFSTDSLTEVIRGRIFTQSVSNCAQSRKEVPFLRILLLPCHVIFLVAVDGIRWGLTYEDMYMRTL